jgi:hypothetical protein
VDPAAAEEGGIPQERASQLAEAYLRTYAQIAAPYWAKDRGAQIDYRSLRSCNRPIYARTAYASPEASASNLLRKQLGSYWLVHVCDAASGPVVIIAVSVHNTDVEVASDGRIHSPAPSGANFHVMGIPVSAEVPLSAETAVRYAASISLRSVEQVPLFVREAGAKAPWLGVWHLRLDVPINVVGKESNHRQSIRDVQVGYPETWKPELLRPAPLPGPKEAVVIDYVSDPTKSHTLLLSALGHVRFERITVEGR